MRPNDLVYKAWKNTEELPYETSVEKRLIELLDPKKHEDFVEFDETECYLCGKTCTSGLNKKKLLPKTFNDHDKAKAPYSDYVCEACSFMILTNPNRRQAIRLFDYVASDKLVICNRRQMREYLINPPDPPFVICITLSQKKHLLWYLKTSYSRDNYFVTMEDKTFQVERNKFVEQLELVERLYNVGYSKAQIESGNLTYGKLPMHEIAESIQKIKEYQKTQMFQLAIYVAQKEEVDKNDK